MIQITRLSDYQSQPKLSLDMMRALDFIDEQIRKGVIIDQNKLLKNINQSLRKRYRMKATADLKGTIVEGWSIQDSEQRLNVYAIILKNGKLALANESDIEKDFVC